MRVKTYKLSPAFIIESLQRELNQTTELPNDAELVDLKFDLITGQILAVLRSNSFQDVSEIQPTETMSLSLPKQNTEPKGEERSCRSVAKLAPCRVAESLEEEFSIEMRKLLKFSVKNNRLLVSPSEPLESKWAEIDRLAKDLGGRWIKEKERWEIPLT